MSDTPRTDAEKMPGCGGWAVPYNFAQTLELELNRCRKGWETAADQPDVQEAVIKQLDLVHRDAVNQWSECAKRLVIEIHRMWNSFDGPNSKDVQMALDTYCKLRDSQ